MSKFFRKAGFLKFKMHCLISGTFYLNRYYNPYDILGGIFSFQKKRKESEEIKYQKYFKF